MMTCCLQKAHLKNKARWKSSGGRNNMQTLMMIKQVWLHYMISGQEVFMDEKRDISQ